MMKDNNKTITAAVVMQ